MKNLVIGFLICYVITGLLIFLYEDFDFCGLYVYLKPWYFLGIVICFIPAVFWYIFQNVIKPVDSKKWEKFKDIYKEYKFYHILGNIYMVYNMKAQVFFHKIYFVAVKK